MCGLVALDRRISDDELWEVLGAFGPLLDTHLAGATPEALRQSGLLEAQRTFADQPSALFEVLLAADQRGTSRHARAYYDAAVELAFAVAAIDLHTSDSELDAIERFRGMLLGAIEGMEAAQRPVTATGASAGRARPGGRSRPARTPRRARSTSCSPSSTPSWGSTA